MSYLPSLFTGVPVYFVPDYETRTIQWVTRGGSLGHGGGNYYFYREDRQGD